MRQEDTDLSRHIQTTPLVDSHEHLCSAKDYSELPPDILQAVFHHYVQSDLYAAGATREAIEQLANGDQTDVAKRFENVRDAWMRVQHTSYGRASQSIAKDVFGISEFSGDAFAQAQEAYQKQPRKSRLSILKEEANVDHVQIDSFESAIELDPEDARFFRYDLNAYSFAGAELNLKALATVFGQEVTRAKDLQDYLDRLFDRHAKDAIAVKTQHAYSRTLDWEDRTDANATHALWKLTGGGKLSPNEKASLGDWSLARVAELAEKHNLPVKIHTGYLAGNDCLDLERTRPSKLWKLFAKYPNVRFVLMHTGYPYGGEIASLAKNFRNVYADLCWAWSIDSYSTTDFVRRMIHTCPSHKLFAFGGDTFYPEATIAFAKQARNGLNNALQAEVDEGFLAEKQAMELASQFMRENQYECFNLRC